MYAVSETNEKPRRRTPLDPDSGPRSSQTNTEPGRIKSRLSTFVSLLVIRGNTLLATASKMTWLSRVFLTRTSVNVGPCIMGYCEGEKVKPRRCYIWMPENTGGNCDEIVQGRAAMHVHPVAITTKCRRKEFNVRCTYILDIRDSDRSTHSMSNVDCSTESER